MLSRAARAPRPPSEKSRRGSGCMGISVGDSEYQPLTLAQREVRIAAGARAKGARCESPPVACSAPVTRSVLVPATRQAIAKKVYPCRVALFFTMFGSIFTAAFFAYADSTSGIDIEQVCRPPLPPSSPSPPAYSQTCATVDLACAQKVLYFTRLFGDLLGRPFTSMPRPSMLRSSTALARFSIARLLFSVVFFLYVFMPGFPQSDVFLVLDVAVFSVMSGYLGIISYEYAARECDT